MYLKIRWNMWCRKIFETKYYLTPPVKTMATGWGSVLINFWRRYRLLPLEGVNRLV